MKSLRLMFFILASGSLLLGLAACGAKPAPTSETASPAEPASAPAGTNSSTVTNTATGPAKRFFLVRGVVKSIDPASKTVTVQHEKVPGFMEAMTMPFKVKEEKELTGIQPGDTIWFRLWVTDDESWIDRVQKEKGQSSTAPAPTPPEREAVRVSRDVPVLRVGDPMPDYHFTNELGQRVNLADFKGQALAFTFFYTRCPLPDFCPRMSKNMQEVAQKLSASTNGPTNWHLLSISFDPTRDTPSVLRGYAAAYHNDPKRWNFVTGSMEDIDAITDQFELTVENDGTQLNHKLRTVVVDAKGRIQNIVFGNEWKPDALVEDIVKAAGR